MTDQVTNETTETTEVKATETITPVATVATPKAPRFIIQLGADGTEISRKPLTKGRPATGATKDANGNWTVPFATQVAKEAKVKAAATPKTPKFIIQLGADGLEASRKPLGKGRAAKGSTINSDGNRVVPFTVKETKVKAEYITLDINGNEVSRVAKGPGRAKPDFEKQTDGKYAGQYVKVNKPEIIAAPAVPVEAAPVVVPTEATLS